MKKEKPIKLTEERFEWLVKKMRQLGWRFYPVSLDLKNDPTLVSEDTEPGPVSMRFIIRKEKADENRSDS